MSNVTLPMSQKELEALVRRVVREEIHRLLRRPYSILDDPRQEGPDDPEEDQELLQESLAMLHGIAERPDAWTSWQDFEAESGSQAVGALSMR